VLSDHELFGRVRRPVTRRGGAGKGLPTVSLEFQPGELVVHVDHGVARFHGMGLKEMDGAEREYLELEYAEGDRLFVPVEFLDRVQKYLGGGEGDPPLNRLGTGAWEKARSRAKKSVEDIADDLLKLYAAREAKPGYAFDPDTPWQSELEASFPFEETPDQLTALAEIKADMESDKPMDRLLCGDVGFGKTELALRAAFKAVQSGKAGGDAGADNDPHPTALPGLQGTLEAIPGRDRDALPIRIRRGRGEGNRGHQGGDRRHRDRDPSGAPEGRPLQAAGARDNRRGAALRGRPERAAEASSRQRRRAHSERHADPPDAAHGGRAGFAT